MYKLEKSVPIPESGAPTKYPFKVMAVGDSFSVPREGGANLRNAASQAARKNGRKFTVRSLGEEVRCWRVS